MTCQRVARGGHVLRACLSAQEPATQRFGERPRSKKKRSVLKKSKSVLEGQRLGRGGRTPGHRRRRWAAGLPGPAWHWTGLDTGGGGSRSREEKGPGLLCAEASRRGAEGRPLSAGSVTVPGAHATYG